MKKTPRIIGYARISTDDQTLDLQTDALIKAGCTLIYKEVASGKNAHARPKLNLCLSQLRAGDRLIVWRLDRLGRSVNDLVNIITMLEEKAIYFESLSEKIDTKSNTGKLIFHIFAALAEFERNLIRERTFAGLAAAKARGRIGGRRPKLNERQIKEINQLFFCQKSSITDLATQYKVSRTTISNKLQKNLGVNCRAEP
ncbi:MAG: recombinase family protein [Neisseriaceae bacterium]|nr:recombinase family protein [Neisseriaceae bacterium]MBP6861749.1 recombinase family protein [Neisseriaceae bacterium]